MVIKKPKQQTVGCVEGLEMLDKSLFHGAQKEAVWFKEGFGMLDKTILCAILEEALLCKEDKLLL